MCSSDLNQQIISQTLFYQTVTFSHPCTISLEEYLQLCEDCPDGYEQSLKVTYRPAQYHLSNTAVVDALLNNQLVVEPILQFESTINGCQTCDADGICTAQCVSQPCKPEGAPKCLNKSTTTACAEVTASSLNTRNRYSNSIPTRNLSRIAS